jgi:hypothetical protein
MLRQKLGLAPGADPAGVVADPDLEQVTQDEEGIGLTGWSLQVGQPGLRRWLGSPACRCRSEMKSTACQCAVLAARRSGREWAPSSCRGKAPGSERDGLFDHHVVLGHVVVEAFAAGGHAFDLLDDVGADTTLPNTA